MHDHSPKRSSTRLLTPILAVAAATALLVVAPSAAVGQQLGPTEDQYAPEVERIGDQVAGAQEAAPPAAPPTAEAAPADRVVSGLPFTGLDIVLLLGVAALLGATGFALRRFASGSAGR